MPQLTRRRDPDARHECWRIYYGDIDVGTISLRAGVPTTVDQWGWCCGFFPLSHRAANLFRREVRLVRHGGRVYLKTSTKSPGLCRGFLMIGEEVLVPRDHRAAEVIV